MGTAKVSGEMISREASMIAVASGAREEGSAGSDTTCDDGSFNACLKAGRTSDIHSAMRFAGSGWPSRRDRWDAEKANIRCKR